MTLCKLEQSFSTTNNVFTNIFALDSFKNYRSFNSKSIHLGDEPLHVHVAGAWRYRSPSCTSQHVQPTNTCETHQPDGSSSTVVKGHDEGQVTQVDGLAVQGRIIEWDGGATTWHSWAVVGTERSWSTRLRCDTVTHCSVRYTHLAYIFTRCSILENVDL